MHAHPSNIYIYTVVKYMGGLQYEYAVSVKLNSFHEGGACKVEDKQYGI